MGHITLTVCSHISHHLYIQGSDNIESISGSDIVVITAGITRKPGMTREELLQKNSQIIREISQQIKRLSPDAIIIVVTNPLDAMTYCVLKETGFPAQRVLGMGLSLDCSRLANLIAQKLKVNISEIEPCIIGSHGEGMLVLSRYTKVKGKSLDSCLPADKVNELIKQTVSRGSTIVSLLTKGSAYFAPSTAIAELIKSMLKDEKKNFGVSTLVNGQYGLSELCIGLPCQIGKRGIEKIIELELNKQERQALLNAAQAIKKQIMII